MFCRDSTATVAIDPTHYIVIFIYKSFAGFIGFQRLTYDEPVIE